MSRIYAVTDRDKAVSEQICRFLATGVDAIASGFSRG